MGRPINSRYIGPSTGPDDDKIRGYGVYANLGDGIVDSVILQQRSTSKFLIAPSADLNNTMVAQLVNSDEPEEGQFFIDLIDTNDQRIKIRKLTNRRVYTADGSSYTWKLNVNGQVNIGNTELAPINLIPFAFVVDTNLDTTNVSVGLSLIAPGSSVTIDWGDGTTDTVNSNGNVAHLYDSDGVYTISVIGDVSVVDFDPDVTTEILNFGTTFNMNRLLNSLLINNTLVTSVPTQLPPNTGRFLSGMFKNSNYNGTDLAVWDFSNVNKEEEELIFMDEMFDGNTSFNQPLNGWVNTNELGNTNRMFRGATSFDQDLGNWQLDSVTNMENMFDNSGMSAENLARTLIGWANHLFTLPSPPTNVTLGISGLTAAFDTYGDISGEFDNIGDAVFYLEATLGWTIVGPILVSPIASFTTEADYENDTTISSGNFIEGVDAIEIVESFGGPRSYRLFNSSQATTPGAVMEFENQNGVFATFFTFNI